MKTAATLAVVAAIALAGAAGSAAAASPWQSLFELDCQGQAHFYSQSMMATSVSAQGLVFALQQYVKGVKDRATCACSGITDAEIARRFVPSVEMALSFLDGNADKTATDCPNAKFQQGFFDNSLFGRDNRDKLSLNLLPSTCSYADYAAGNACQFKVVETITDTEIQFAAKQCKNADGSNTFMPFISVTCKGTMCDNALMPCKATADCGTNMKCQEVMTADNWKEFMENSNLVSAAAELSGCGGTDAFMNQMITKIAGYFPGAASSWAGSSFSLCMPDVQSDEAPFEGQFTGSSAILTDDTAANACMAKFCDLSDVGDGRCDPECNNAECKYDGWDCTQDLDSDCPSNNAKVECSGHGNCDDDSGTCYCSGDSVGSWSGSDCSTCTAHADQSDCSNVAKSSICNGEDWCKPELVTASNANGGGLKAWDGTMADGEKATSAARMSGFAFSSIGDGAQSRGGQDLWFYGGDHGYGFNFFNRRLGGAMKPKHQMELGDFMGGMIKDIETCRANGLGVTPLTDAQMAVRFWIYKGVPQALYGFSAPIDFSYGADFSDWNYLPRMDTDDYKNFPRFKFPNTCTLAGFLDNDGKCGAQYSYLSSLLGADFKLQVGTENSADYPKSFMNYGFSAEGPVAEIIRSPTPCSADGDCSDGLKCTDFAGADILDFDNTFKGAMGDPAFSNILFGPRNNDRTCSNPTRFRKSIRNFLLELGGRDGDDGTSLKFCFLDFDAIKDRAENWVKNIVSNTGCLSDDDGGRLRHLSRHLSEAQGMVNSVLSAVDSTGLGDVRGRMPEMPAMPSLPKPLVNTLSMPGNKVGDLMRTLRDTHAVMEHTRRSEHLRGRRTADCLGSPVVVNQFESLPDGLDLIPSPETAIDVAPQADADHQFVVATVTLPGLTKETFDEGKKTAFKRSVADSVSTSDAVVTEDDVFITRVEDASRRLSGRALAGGLKVDYAIHVHKDIADAVNEKVESTTYAADLGSNLEANGAIAAGEGSNIEVSAHGIMSSAAPPDDSAAGSIQASWLTFLAAALAALAVRA